MLGCFARGFVLCEVCCCCSGSFSRSSGALLGSRLVGTTQSVRRETGWRPVCEVRAERGAAPDDPAPNWRVCTGASQYIANMDLIRSCPLEGGARSTRTPAAG